MESLEQYAKLIGGWFWETDHRHRFVYISQSIEMITGVKPEWHYGKSRMEIRDAADADDALWSNHIESLDAHEPFYEFRFHRLGPDGVRWLSTSGEPFFDDSGAFMGYRGVARDVTQEMALSKEAKDLRSQLFAALEIIDEGFVYFDADDRLVLCNEKYRQYYPKSRDLIVPGVRFEDIIRSGAERGEYEHALGRIDEWVAERMESHKAGNALIEQRLTDGRWLRIAERRTPDGGIVGMRVDVTKLMEAQEAAENANKAKSEFLATMSHELRTPLTSIKGSLGLLNALASDGLSSQGNELLEMAVRNSDAMLALINELLDYEKILSGSLVIETSPHDLAKLTFKVVKDNQGYANAHSVNFTYAKPAKPAYANVQEHRFEQVLRNLLSNAAKFSEPGSDVEVSLSKNNGTISVRVADNGPGIPEEFGDKIFEQFSQLDSSSTREKSGTGLGLPISKALTEGMGGTIDFESEIGAGSVFFVSFAEANDHRDGS